MTGVLRMAKVPAAAQSEAVTEARRKRLFIHKALKEGGLCARCERVLAPGEVVWRVNTYMGISWFSGASKHWVLPTCEACATGPRKYRRWWPETPCEHCGRPVRNQQWMRYRRHTFCCEQCESRHYARIARERRALKRTPRACAECGETFTPRRADALYCSGRCRQRAYRKRKADAAPVTDADFLAGEKGQVATHVEVQAPVQQG